MGGGEYSACKLGFHFSRCVAVRVYIFFSLPHSPARGGWEFNEADDEVDQIMRSFKTLISFGISISTHPLQARDNGVPTHRGTPNTRL